MRLGTRRREVASRGGFCSSSFVVVRSRRRAERSMRLRDVRPRRAFVTAFVTAFVVNGEDSERHRHGRVRRVFPRSGRRAQPPVARAQPSVLARAIDERSRDRVALARTHDILHDALVSARRASGSRAHSLAPQTRVRARSLGERPRRRLARVALRLAHHAVRLEHARLVQEVSGMDERVARAHDVRGGVDELVRLQRARPRGDLAPRDAREALLVRVVPARGLGRDSTLDVRGPPLDPFPRGRGATRRRLGEGRRHATARSRQTRARSRLCGHHASAARPAASKWAIRDVSNALTFRRFFDEGGKNALSRADPVSRNERLRPRPLRRKKFRWKKRSLFRSVVCFPPPMISPRRPEPTPDAHPPATCLDAARTSVSRGEVFGTATFSDVFPSFRSSRCAPPRWRDARRRVTRVTKTCTGAEEHARRGARAA